MKEEGRKAAGAGGGGGEEKKLVPTLSISGADQDVDTP